MVGPHIPNRTGPCRDEHAFQFNIAAAAFTPSASLPKAAAGEPSSGSGGTGGEGLATAPKGTDAAGEDAPAAGAAEGGPMSWAERLKRSPPSPPASKPPPHARRSVDNSGSYVCTRSVCTFPPAQRCSENYSAAGSKVCHIRLAV